MSIQTRGLHDQLRPYADWSLDLAAQYGIKPVVTSVLRSWENQTTLRRKFENCVARGRFPSPPDCKYPANRPGDSAHNYGLAWDSWVPADQMPLWIAIREYVGWRVPRNDLIHSELPQWRSYVS